jgi:hypothetical protein
MEFRNIWSHTFITQHAFMKLGIVNRGDDAGNSLTNYFNLFESGVSLVDMIYFVNRNCVGTRWQQYSTHLVDTRWQQYSTHLVDTRWQQYSTHLVDTRWKQYSTHLHTNSTHNTENETYIKKIGTCAPCPGFPNKRVCTLRVLECKVV